MEDLERLENLESNQKIVMDEEFVQNGVMDAKIDPKIAMDLFIFKNWWMEHSANQKSKIVGRTLLLRMNRDC